MVDLARKNLDSYITSGAETKKNMYT